LGSMGRTPQGVPVLCAGLSTFPLLPFLFLIG